jgi:hypothetical protein
VAPVVHGLKQVYGDRVNIMTIDITPSQNTQFYTGNISEIQKAADNLKVQLAPSGTVREIDSSRPYLFLLSPDGEILGSWTYYLPAEEIQLVIEAAFMIYGN